MMDRREFLQVSAAGTAASVLPIVSLGQASGSMVTRPIHSTGQRIGVVGMGNSPVFSEQGTFAAPLEMDVAERETRAREMIRMLIAHGGRLIDATFGTISNLARILPGEDFEQILFVTSPYAWTQGQVATRSHVEALMSILNKNPLDILQLRNPMTTEFTERYWPLLKEWKQEGLVRHIGPSGAGPAQVEVMERVMNDGADFIHIDYSFNTNHTEERLLPVARDTGTAVFTNRPFESGIFFRLVAGRTLPEWAAEIDCETWAQFNLKWILGNPTITSTFFETSNPEHALDNLGAGFGRFPDQDMRNRMKELIASFQ